MHNHNEPDLHPALVISAAILLSITVVVGIHRQNNDTDLCNTFPSDCVSSPHLSGTNPVPVVMHDDLNA